MRPTDSHFSDAPETVPPRPCVQVSSNVIVGLRVLLGALSVLLIGTFLQTALERLHFAFQYDFIEDGAVQCVQHLLKGQPLYQQPSILFTPFLYTPAYFYVSAFVARFTGASYVPLRLVSIVSTMGCFGLIYALVYREVRKHLAALAAVGCFAACYPVVKEWFDLGRVDMLYLLLVLCALYATRWLHPAFAALLWVCAFQTKQGVLPVAVLALCHDWQRPRRVAVGLASYGALLLGSVAWLPRVTGSWYRYYVFHLASGLGYDMHQAKHFLPSDLLGELGFAVLIILAAWLLTPPNLRSRPTSFYLLNTLGMVVFTGFIRAHRGASVNALLPAYVWIAVLFGIALGRLGAVLEGSRENAARLAWALVLTTASVQLAVHMYAAREFVPRADQVAKRMAFVDQLRSIPGEVLVLNFPQDGVLAGKQDYAQGEAVGAVIDAKDTVQGDRIMAEYAAMIDQEKFSAVGLELPAEFGSGKPRFWMPKDFQQHYPLRVPAIGGEETQFGAEPKWIYLPCSQAEAAKQMDPSLDITTCAESVRAASE